MRMTRQSTAWKLVLLSAAFWMIQSVSVHAQTVEECYAERDKLQDWIGEQDNQDVYSDAQALIERADLAASQGDGKKCMELIRDANGAARSLGAN